eukprot:CAMPEP_0180510860 /NCGR_PEP_ID=MMETSP1036_2-20121128/50649_1 /TAXON_ID=632150 /ORGANISM="Azadinium spinosum, Strain 3D9" /LENGTH=154 /DNA_ID=CAMNT_0022521699 /DNA_START=234 /DNA_END=698 /DNA_ORIENTATION=+
MTLPSDQVYASTAVISACVFGLDSAKTTGRFSFRRTRASTIGFVKQFGTTPTAPTTHEGLSSSTSTTKSSLRKLPVVPSSERQIKPRELVTKIDEAGSQQLHEPDVGRACSMKEEGLLRQLASQVSGSRITQFDRPQQGRQCNSSCALNVVIVT